jgi:hypothetical protein
VLLDASKEPIFTTLFPANAMSAELRALQGRFDETLAATQ